MTNFKKIAGWLLLLSGLIIIFWTLYTSFNIFTAKTVVPEVFKLKAKETTIIEQKKQSLTPEEAQEEVRKIINEQLNEIIPPEFLTKLLNLISWSIFAGILLFGGGKISAIGIKMLAKGS